MRGNSATSRWPELLLGLAVVWIVVGNIFWLHADASPPGWDDSYYLRLGLQYHDALRAEGLRALASALVETDPLRPPLIPALTIPVIAVLGRAADEALSLYVVGFVVLALATYGIGRRVSSRRCGVLAAVIVCGYPSVIVYSRVFLLDFGTAVLVAAGLYFLIRSDAFRFLPSTVATGALLGGGVLSRTFAPVFLLGPLAVGGYAAWRAARSGARADGWHRLHSIALGTGAAVLVAGWWYIPNLPGVAGRSVSAAYGAESQGYGPRNPVRPSALARFFLVFLNKQLTLIGLILLGLALWILWSRIVRRSGDTPSGRDGFHFATLASALAVPYVFFTVLRAQDPKNITPVLTAAAVLTAWGLTSMTASIARKALVALAVAWSLFQFCAQTYGLPMLPHRAELRTVSDVPRLMVYSENYKPRRARWPVAEILLRIEARRTELGVGSGPLVGIVADHPYINYSNLRYFATVHRLPLAITRIGPGNQPRDFYRKQLAAAAFVIVKTGYPGPPFVNAQTSLISAQVRSSPAFRELAEFLLPDGSKAAVYERR